MIAAGLILWTLIALAVGIVIGTAIRLADDLAEPTKPAPIEAPLYVPGSWVA